MKRRIKSLCLLLFLSLAHEFTRQYQYYHSVAPDVVLDKLRGEPNYLSAVIVAVVVWGLCELLFWGIAKRRKKNKEE